MKNKKLIWKIIEIIITAIVAGLIAGIQNYFTNNTLQPNAEVAALWGISLSALRKFWI